MIHHKKNNYPKVAAGHLPHAKPAQGFLRYLLIFFLLLAVLIWFLPAPLIKWGIEKYGSEAVGAQVDVGSVNFSWLATSLAVRDIAVTNPDKPMSNLLALQTVSTDIKVAELLSRQIYLNELAIEGVAVDTPRRHSGAIPGLVKKPLFEKQDDGLVIPGMKLPNVDELVANEKAVYKKRIAELEAQIENKKQQWQAIKAGLPDKAKLETYKQRFKALNKDKDPFSRLKALADLKKLGDEIKADLRAFDQAKDQIRADYRNLQSRLAELRNMPNQSYAESLKTLGLQDSQLGQLGVNLLEGPMRAWIEKGYNYYKLLTAGTGSKKPARIKTQPQFIIETTKLSGPFTQGNVKGQINGLIKNMSDAPELAGKPILIDLKAEGGQLGKILVDGAIDHLSKGKEKDKLRVKISGLPLENFPLSADKALTLVMKEALLDFDAEASLTSLARLQVNFTSLFKSLQMAASSDQAGSTRQAIVKAIQQLSMLSVQGKVKGTVNDPQLRLKSNLDDALKQVFRQVLRGKTKGYKKELTRKLNAELDGKLKPLEERLSQAFGIQAQLDKEQAAFSRLIRGL